MAAGMDWSWLAVALACEPWLILSGIGEAKL